MWQNTNQFMFKRLFYFIFFLTPINLNPTNKRSKRWKTKKLSLQLSSRRQTAKTTEPSTPFLCDQLQWRPRREQEEKFSCCSPLSCWSTTSDALWRETACFLHVLEDTNKWTVLHWLANSFQASKPHTVLIDLQSFLLSSQKFALFMLRIFFIFPQPSSFHVPAEKKTWALVLGICITSFSNTKETRRVQTSGRYLVDPILAN